jgi:hypothetical protein
MGGLGRTLIVAGAILLFAGLVVSGIGRYTPLGRLPGDIVYRRSNFTFYFPIMTSIVLSILFSIVMWLFHRR